MIAPKLITLESSIVNAMTELGNSHNAINMAAGYTDFHCSPRLIELVQKHISQGINELAPAYGVLQLREKIAEKIENLYGHYYNPETEITITAGATQALFTTITALIREGDEVVVFEPACDSYVPAIEINGGRPVFVPLKGTDFHIDWEEVQKLITSNTRMIIINTPHSPTGMVFSELDMLRLQKIINGTRIIVLADEIFEHMVYNGESHQSVALYPKLAEQSIIISSFGETYHVSGWQIGYCAGPANIMAELRKVQQVMMQSVSSPFQWALSEFLDFKEEYLHLSEFYVKKRDRFTELMRATRFKPILSRGSFYQLFSYEEISDENDKDFAIRLIKESGVTTVPISAFYHEKSKKYLLRFNFARTDEHLQMVAERLSKW
ncbi:methionine aminotransferase [Thermophagus xiamenensis]|uniref:2-keto-4-methylthiobutyrate aminotransferase apoenzyme n=1 Tax=Thermophagus xiamenensis TaxID=385682 RepID=A0A1I2ENI0_9BACT|nr:methionine aminotransferase [Thermophagus xiamenensis]SFE94435.1 2-keto-4-methylthiobutyrate aminotransferase apoenzyme [Thermophagus xiamenensis]